MITLSKSGNSVTFTFDENSGYLQNGTIDVPVNSLALITDESDMATFRKSASNDIFVSARYEEFGMTKAELEAWYKANMVGSTGGGGGVTPEEVQGMIDESISGKADADDVYTIEEVDDAISAATDDMATETWVGAQGYITGVDLSNYATLDNVAEAVSGKADIGDIPDVSNYFDGAEYDSGTTRINFYHGNTVKAYIDASAFVIDGMIDDVRIETISGVSYLVIDFNTASGKEDIQIPLTDIFDPSNYYTKTEVDASLSGKADTTAVTEAISAATDDMATKTWVGEQGYLTEHQSLSAYSTTEEVNSAITEATSGKVDTSTYTAYTAATDTEIGNKLAVSDFNTYSGAVDTAINSKASESDLSALTDVVSAHTANTDIHVTTAQTAAWNAKSDFSGSYNDLTDKPTIPTVPTSNTAFTNDAGYITEDAISGKADSSAVTEEISAAVSGKVDTSTFETYSGSVETALSGKQDTLSAGTNITISGNVISAEGGGKAVSGGTNISITTGETADTINCTLPISADTGGIYTTSSYPFTSTAPRSYNAVFGNNNVIDVFGSGRRSDFNALFGDNNSVKPVGGSSSSHFIAGSYNRVKGAGNFRNALFGYYNTSQNNSEFGCGQYNVSSSASTTFGDSGNTLFSVGNGTADNARHNAFEIRQNGDIYLTKDGQDVKLQDNLGGGTASSAITSGDTNPVQGGVLYNELRIDGKDWLTLEWNNYDGGEATNYPSGESSKIMFEVVASGGTEEDPWVEESNGFSFQDSENNELGLIVINIDYGVVTVDDESSHDVTYSISGNIVTVEYPSIAANVDNIYSSYDSHWVTKAEVDAKVPLINQVSANTNSLGGLKLAKVTQAQYDALVSGGTVDNSTIYYIVN